MTVNLLISASGLLFMLQINIALNNELPSKNLHHHSLHHHMTKREIQQFFGVDVHDKVPEYDITHPYQSNEQGDFVSYSIHTHTRNKRDTEPHESPFYKMDAFGSKLLLKLKRNDKLLPPGMTVQRQNSDGTTTVHPAPANTFYLGQVSSDPKSLIAVSNHGGLTGMVKTSSDTLFVHPLPAHLAKHVASNRDASPHLVYRRSLKENHFGCKTPEEVQRADLKRTVQTEHQESNTDSDESDRPRFRTLKAGYLYPQRLADKYNQDYLRVLGGVENYLALVANIVAGLFQDHTMGKTKITYALTNISMIAPQEYGFKESDYPGVKLTKLNAILNRKTTLNYDVFSYVSNQNAGGGAVAFYGEMCKGITGNVNSDVGLHTAFHIAHETAHNMYVSHDYGNCDKDYIMKEKFPIGVHATEWSPCSRHALQGFLADRRRSFCLDDGLTKNTTVFDLSRRNKLPGLILNGDKQCESHYGRGWKRIQKHLCTILMCNFQGVTLSIHSVVMDGTSCSPGKWCIKGICQSTGLMETASVDYWTDWSSHYSQCTRSCGGGVQFTSRHCTHPNPGNKYCQGQNRKYQICNPQACPTNSLTFRDQQCAERIPGTKAYTGRQVPNAVSCGRLYCLIPGRATSAGVVMDGTRCTLNKYDLSVCVQGRCRPVGCDDNVLDSTVQFDRCGVCGGNGTTCSAMKEFKYTGRPNARGPDSATLITELLPGTSKASFRMTRKTYDYFGVQDATGKYLVGGHMGQYQKINAAGTVIELHHRRGRKSRDYLSIAKENPLTAVLRVMYIKSGATGSEVKCKYLPPTIPPSPEDFKWDVGDWSSCSLSCASGAKTRTLRCVRKDDETPASDHACPKPMPNKTEPCNTQPCEAKWEYTEWSLCTRTCGLGQQNRLLRCLQEVTKNNFADSDKCTNATKPMDSTVRGCNAYPCPAYWKEGNWSNCSAKCPVGTGKRERIVSCMRISEQGVPTVIDDVFCRNLEKPASEEKCNADQPCDLMLNPCDNISCLNGGTCSPGVGANDHICLCTDHFTGRNCETAITACMSNPCLNGASCSDNGDRIEYTCNCSDAFMGDRCQVATFYGIACFIHKAREVLLGRLQDLSKELNFSNTEPTIVRCAELAHTKGYRFFALGSNGICYSGHDGGNKYFKHGSAKKENCVNGVGRKGVMYVYTFDPIPGYEQLGCYVAQKGSRKKAFRIKYFSFANQFDSADTRSTIQRCLRVAIGRGFKYFSVRDSAVCWSDQSPSINYHKFGSSKACNNGVGLKGKKSMVVYKING